MCRPRGPPRLEPAFEGAGANPPKGIPAQLQGDGRPPAAVPAPVPVLRARERPSRPLGAKNAQAGMRCSCTPLHASPPPLPGASTCGSCGWCWTQCNQLASGLRRSHWGCTGQGAWQVFMEVFPEEVALGMDGPEGLARVDVSGEAQGKSGHGGKGVWALGMPRSCTGLGG